MSRTLRCGSCAKPITQEDHASALSTRCALEKKVYEAFDRELQVHSRAAAPDELDDDGNPVVCVVCTARTVEKVKRERR